MLQQEKKTDFNSIIGFALIGIVLFWFLNNQAGIEETQLQTTTEEVSSSNKTVNRIKIDAMKAYNAREGL